MEEKRKAYDFEWLYAAIGYVAPNMPSGVAVVGVSAVSAPSLPTGSQEARFDYMDRVLVHEVIALQRITGPYLDTYRTAQNLLTDPALFLITERETLLDLTVVGAGIADQIDDEADRNTYLVPVLFTNDRASGYSGGIYTVPLRDALSALVNAVSAHRFKIANTLALAAPLAGELQRIDLSGDLKEITDPLLRAVAMVVWRAETENQVQGVYADRLEKENAGPKPRAVWDIWEGMD